jgi:hypothetical protein
MICFQRLFHLSLWNIEEGGGAASLQGSQKAIAKKLSWHDTCQKKCFQINLKLQKDILQYVATI